MPHKYNVHAVSKEFLIRTIDKYGCKMLKNRLKGDETKEEIILFLRICECPVLKKMFTGL